MLGGATLGLLAGAAARRDPVPSGVLSAGRVPLVLAGISIAVYQSAFFLGVHALGIAVGTILAIGSAPFFAGIVAIASGQGRPTRAWLGTTVLAVVGLVLLVRPEPEAPVPLVGALAALGAGAAFGSFTVLAKGLLGRGFRRLDTVALPFLIAGVPMLPVLVLGLLGSEDPGAVLRTPGVLVVLWLALGATALAYVLFVSGLRGVSAFSGTTLMLAEPLTAALLGVLVFAEGLRPSATVGALTVGAALLLAARRSGQDPAR